MVVFYGISTLLGYLMLNHTYTHIHMYIYDLGANMLVGWLVGFYSISTLGLFYVKKANILLATLFLNEPEVICLNTSNGL